MAKVAGADAVLGVVPGGDTLAVPVVADGGFAALACRWYPGRTTCDR